MKDYFKLTEREKEVKELIIQGLTNRQIAQKLFISIHTAKSHVYNILNKLSVNSKIELILQELGNKKKLADPNQRQKNKIYTEQQKYIINILEEYVKTTGMLSIDSQNLKDLLGLKNVNKPISDLNKRFKEINNTKKNLISYDRKSEFYIIASIDSWMPYFKLN